MDGIPVLWIILVIIGWAVSAAKKTQQQQQKQQQQAQARRSAQTGQARPAQTVPGKEGSSGRSPAAHQPAGTVQAKPAPAKPFQPVRPTESSAFVSAHSAPLETHMHTPEMGVEGEGTEGIDCCHEYMLDADAPAEPMDILSLNETDQAEKAQALLQGVIFSEILGRRHAKQYGRRSA